MTTFDWGLDGQDPLEAIQLTTPDVLFVDPSDFRLLFQLGLSVTSLFAYWNLWQKATTIHQRHSMDFGSTICQSWLKIAYPL